MKILIPVDGSDCAINTLQWASELFDKQKTEYHLLYVMSLIADCQVFESNLTGISDILGKAREELEKRGCKVAQADYVIGLPASQINQYALEQQIDQVVIGTHGRTGIMKFLMGSVSQEVLEHCPCPVIVYRNSNPLLSESEEVACKPGQEAHS